MKNKNKKLIIVIIIILLLVIMIPIVVFSIKKFEQPNFDINIAEENEKENQRLLEEKKEFEKNPQNVKEITDSSKISKSEEIEYDESQQEINKKEEKIKSIMNRYYEKEFKRILEDINKENTGLVDIKSDSIPKAEAELYDLIMKVLEEKELTENEAEVLKDFLNIQQENIKKDNKLKVRFEKILQ